jgi:hypothetical protein
MKRAGKIGLHRETVKLLGVRTGLKTGIAVTGYTACTCGGGSDPRTTACPSKNCRGGYN